MWMTVQTCRVLYNAQRCVMKKNSPEGKIFLSFPAEKCISLATGVFCVYLQLFVVCCVCFFTGAFCRIFFFKGGSRVCRSLPVSRAGPAAGACLREPGAVPGGRQGQGAAPAGRHCVLPLHRRGRAKQNRIGHRTHRNGPRHRPRPPPAHIFFLDIVQGTCVCYSPCPRHSMVLAAPVATTHFLWHLFWQGVLTHPCVNGKFLEFLGMFLAFDKDGGGHCSEKGYGVKISARTVHAPLP